MMSWEREAYTIFCNNEKQTISSINLKVKYIEENKHNKNVYM